MLTVYSKINSNRFRYALKLVLEEVCQIEYKIIDNKSEISSQDYVINYSGELIHNSFQIHPSGLLSEKDYKRFDINFEYGGDEMLKLFVTEFDSLGYDIFSASFFLATRMEEYWNFQPDEHGRYSSNNSILHKLGVLHLPLINIWGKVFIERINRFFNTSFAYAGKRCFKIINTIDIDNAWAYRNKGFYRTVGGFFRAVFKGDFIEAKERITCLFNQPDPYDTYDYILSVTNRYNLPTVFFFLLGNRNEYDKNIHHKHPAMRQLILRLSENADVGIHPSYASFLNPKLQKTEITRLQNIINQRVTIARKHFLRLSIPESYRIYETNGIKKDYTMGYADAVGFRAGICTPFTFFDLLQDRELKLTIYPFAYMDGTLNQYLNFSPKEAINKITQLQQQVKDVNGLFIGIWHNETLNDKGIWRGWKVVFEKAVRLGEY